MRTMLFRSLIKQALTRASKVSILLIALFLAWSATLAPVEGQDEREGIKLTPLGSYASGIFNAGGAEIVAHDPKNQRLFVINAQAATVDVLTIADPELITRVAQIDVKPYGSVANSVAVDKDVVAVAVENALKTDPGKVVFFAAKDLSVLNALQVGALPDMLTFSPDGKWLLVANEGEPNDAYTVDPEGTVSIIEMKGDLTKLSQGDGRSVDFRAFDAGPLPVGIRIFGPNAKVSQDMEPEYIAVSPDSIRSKTRCWSRRQRDQRHDDDLRDHERETEEKGSGLADRHLQLQVYEILVLGSTLGRPISRSPVIVDSRRARLCYPGSF